MSVESKEWSGSKEAKEFVEQSIVLDFFASPHGTGWTEPAELLNYLASARAAGVTGHSMTIAQADDNWETFLKSHHQFRNTLLQDKENVTFVHSVRDIEHAHENGTTAVIWNSQSSTILSGDLTRVAALREFGIANMQLVYNGRFRTGVGCIEAMNTPDTGLTDWGRAIIDEMVRHGIVLDLSHASRKTTEDAIAHMDQNHSGVPVVYTHSIPSGLYKNEPNATPNGCYRNISDEQAQRAAETGGVVAPTFTEWMMDGVWPDDITPLQCAQMIDYYAKLVGVDHVGIATDDMMRLDLVLAFTKANPSLYNDGGYMVDAFDRGAAGCGELSKIIAAVTDELWKMGYSNEDIQKFYGGNFMRVWDRVWM
ncbi:Membrane dipeptidase (Peptidase family M19) [Symmachiella macrocystis]|uniref:Membrane dipeptidase (Peptidase family M19) n=1 Tax=Symmachiella macrocystis TaxID=2527985 RepID=A0A5C6BPE0_9PLAN|nr:membrane dipeptidase [Symmachiella macrocystis]TWU13895.1 Membrane dipeptidase (Peptidase family M19) [Symmachiella macrocystis]